MSRDRWSTSACRRTCGRSSSPRRSSPSSPRRTPTGGCYLGERARRRRGGGGRAQYTDDPRITLLGDRRATSARGRTGRARCRPASAPYFSLIQDDDTWEPTFLATRVAFLERHPDVRLRVLRRAQDRPAQPGDRVRAVHSLPREGRLRDPPRRASISRASSSSAMYRHEVGGRPHAGDEQLGVMSRRTRAGGRGRLLRRELPVPVLRHGAVHAHGAAVPDRVPGHPGRRATDAPSEHHQRGDGFDGEHWIRFHQYNAEWFQRELPGLRCPRSTTSCSRRRTSWARSTHSSAASGASARAISAHAVRRRPDAMLNPRVPRPRPAAWCSGRRGADMLTRARSPGDGATTRSRNTARGCETAYAG